MTIKDSAAYGLIMMQGHGKMGVWDIETPTLIRFGQLTYDEFFVTEQAAKEGVKITNPPRPTPSSCSSTSGPDNPGPEDRIRCTGSADSDGNGIRCAACGAPFFFKESRLELEPVYIPIRKVDNVRHAYLGLEGTILLFDQRQAAIDSELLIPVELVTISEGRRFKGRRLIAACCVYCCRCCCPECSGDCSPVASPTAEIEGTVAVGDPRPSCLRGCSWRG